MSRYIKFKTVFLFALLCFPAFSQEVTRPRFLVDEEPIPYVINVDGTLSDTWDMSEGRIDALPIPIIMNENTLLLAGAGFISEKHMKFSDNFMGAYVSIFMTGNLGKNFYYQTYQSVGAFGYSSVLSDTSTIPWKYFQFSFVGYKWSSWFASDLGVMHISNFGNPVWIPLLQATFSLHRFIIDFALPLSATVRFMANKHLHILLKGSFESSSYQMNNELIQFSKPSILSQAEFNMMKGIWLKAGIKYEFQGNTHYQNTKTILPEAWKIYAGLELRIK